MCYQPKTIFVSTTNPNVGVGTDFFIDDDGVIKYKRKVEVPCGVCLDCLEKEATMWAHRIADEASLYKDNCMLTLTYAEDRLSLNRRDLTLFLKRLRKHLEPQKIRFFYCGEYGSKGKRPHYHVIVFGWRPNDLVLWKKSKKGFDCWLSATVCDLWSVPVKGPDGTVLKNKAGKPLKRPIGICEVSDLTLRSSKYSAKYLQKYQPVPDGVVKPFTGMSTNPGIGFLKINPKSLETDKIWHEGTYVKVPRYYLNKLSDVNPIAVEQVKELRLVKGEKFKLSVEQMKALEEKCKRVLDKKLNPL